MEGIYVEIIEQPVPDGVRFRYKCEGRCAGSIRGVNGTFPTIKVHGYRGVAEVVVSLVTKGGPPFYPHPHNLVGKKSCANGVCYKRINNSEMILSFPYLGIQCVKKKEINESLAQREALRIDPFGTGFAHRSNPNFINLTAVRLCFQVLIPDSNGKLRALCLPAISTPIFDNKTLSDLAITKLSHCSAPVTGMKEIILLCDQVNKDDIEIIFYEEKCNERIWDAQGKFSPYLVHRKVAIAFQTPAYRNPNIQEAVHCFIQLRRPSDGAVGKPRMFTLIPSEEDGLVHKRKKYIALRLGSVLQQSNIDSENYVDANARVIKHAVRKKSVFQKRDVCQFSPSYVHANEFNPPNPASTLGTVNCSEDVIPQYHSEVPVSTANPEPAATSTNAISEQIGFNNAKNAYGTSADESFDSQSNLDIGLDSTDLEVCLGDVDVDSLLGATGFSSLSLQGEETADE